MKLMFWSSVNFQNGLSYLMKSLDWFHSFVMFFLISILVMVSLMLFFVLSSNLLDSHQHEFQIMEFFWTLLPCSVLMILGVPSLKLLYNSEMISDSPSVSLKVTAHQWYWSYDYSDFSSLSFDSYMLPTSSLNNGGFRLLEVDNRVVLPFNSLVRFIISSADVLHSWAVPSLGVKVDANPGRLNQICSLSLLPQIMFGQCSEICGANHSFMPIVLEFCHMSLFKSFVNFY